MLLVDSSVWIDFFKGNKSVAAFKLYESLEKELIITCDLIRLDVLREFAGSSSYIQAKNSMDLFPQFNLNQSDLILKASDNIHTLKQFDISTPKSGSSIIATYCIENEIPLLHNDPDYKYFERYLGLKTK